MEGPSGAARALPAPAPATNDRHGRKRTPALAHSDLLFISTPTRDWLATTSPMVPVSLRLKSTTGGRENENRKTPCQPVCEAPTLFAGHWQRTFRRKAIFYLDGSVPEY